MDVLREPKPGAPGPGSRPWPSAPRSGERGRLETRNFVLLALRDADRRALEPDLKVVDLPSGEVLYEPGYPVEWIWFPNNSVLSVVTVMGDGRTVESDTVGCESVVGVLAGLTSSVSTSRTFTQIPGSAFRLSASRLRHRADSSVELRTLLLRHSQANLAQAHQSVACNALHEVNQRLSRWLLMSQDRTASDGIELTQQYLATMVGVQRTTITQALGDLAGRGLIRRGRGRIEILDRDGMEALACECYGVVRSSLETLIGKAPEPA